MHKQGVTMAENMYFTHIECAE